VRGIQTDYLIVGAGAADLSSWRQRSRLNAARGISDHLDDPQMHVALARLFANIEPAIAKLETFAAELPRAGADRAAARGSLEH